MPSDCLKTEDQLDSLINATKDCFSPENYPVRSVARRIKNDVDSLRNIIKQLENDRSQQNHNDNDNTPQSSYSFSSIKAKITSDNKWCHY